MTDGETMQTAYTAALRGLRRNRLDLVSRMVVCTVCFTQDDWIAA